MPGIETNFKGFIAVDKRGELVGPLNPWLRFPKFGGPVWELVKAQSTAPALPRPVREAAILVTATKFHSAYEIYAHVLVAELIGLPTTKSRRSFRWPSSMIMCNLWCLLGFASRSIKWVRQARKQSPY